MKINVIKLNKAIEVGTIIPMEEINGNIGRWVEDRLEENGYSVNRGKGVDLKQLGVEVKTRKVGSTSGHTVGAMLPQDIINTQWEDSNIHDKIQRQYRVDHKINPLTGDNIVVGTQVYDFTDFEIQARLKEAWEHCQGVLAQGVNSDYIRGTDKWAYLEMQDTGYYQFRIPCGIMKRMERMSILNRTKLFEIGN